MAIINLIIDNNTRQVSKNRSFAGVCLENLQDEFLITFKGEFIDGDATMEYQVNGNSYYINMDKNGESYTLDITQTLISEEGVYPFQVRIQNGESVFKSQIFYLKIYPSLNAIDGEPDYYGWQQWVIDYVEENGGKIDVIARNGVELPIIDKVVNISVPTATSQLTNDSGFITEATIPTKTSDLQNDSGFITSADVPTKDSDLINDRYVRFDTNAQNLNTTQKENARTNIGAGVSDFSGSYNDLTNKPTIPSSTSELTNDSGFITSSDIPSVDQTYDSGSSLAQSGIAVAQAVASASGGTRLYRHDITMMAMQRSGEVEIHLIYTSTSNVPINNQTLFEQAFNYDKLKLDMVLRDDTNSYISILCVNYNQDGTANTLVSMNAGLPITDITSMVTSYSDTITQL